MSNVRPIFGHREAPRLSDPVRLTCVSEGCHATVLYSRENGLPDGWKRVTVWRGDKSRRGVTCRWCNSVAERMAATGQSCFVEVIGGGT